MSSGDHTRLMIVEMCVCVHRPLLTSFLVTYTKIHTNRRNALHDDDSSGLYRALRTGALCAWLARGPIRSDGSIPIDAPTHGRRRGARGSNQAAGNTVY